MGTNSKDIVLDKILVDRVKDGDEAAFDEMVSRYWDRIFSRVLQLLKNRQDAEEVTQDAFVRAHRGLANFRGEASFSTWLFQIATNLAHNKYWYWWRRKRDVSFSLEQPIVDDRGVALIDVLPDRTEDPSSEVLTREFLARVTECLDYLSENHREILILRTVKYMTYEEIAQDLQINVGTVKSRIARARENLRKKMGREFK